MNEGNPKGTLRVVVIAVSIMAVLYGYLAYAATIEEDMNYIADKVDKLTKKNYPLDAGIIAALPNVENMAITQQLNAIAMDLYGQNFNGAAVTNLSPSLAAVTKHFGAYCLGAGLESGTCPNDILYKYADANFDILAAGTRYDLTDNRRQEAIEAFLGNLFNSPSQNLVASLKDKLSKSKGGVNITTFTGNTDDTKAFAQALSDEAFLSVIRAVFAEMKAIRTPIGGNPTADSEMEFMAREAYQRAFSTAWKNSLADKKTDEILKEMLLIQAQQQIMEYKRYRQLERLEAVMAAYALYAFRTDKTTQAQISAGQSGGAGGNSSGTPPPDTTNLDTMGQGKQNMP